MPEFLKSENFFTLLAAVIAFLAGTFVAIYTHRYSFTKQRYEDFVNKLFWLSEPLLYKNLSEIDISPLLDFISANTLYVKSKMLETVNLLENDSQQETFVRLCDQIGDDYDRCRWSLGLQKRTISYRINTNQYRNKRYFIYATIKLCLEFMFYLFMLITFFISALIVIFVGFYMIFKRQ